MDINEELKSLCIQYKIYTPISVPKEQLSFPFMEDESPNLWTTIS